jgi:predicted DNA-binding transcriptional regulator YafY
LSLTELMALYFSRDLLRALLRNTPFQASFESLFEKLKATLPPEYLTYLSHLEQTLQVGGRPSKPCGRLADRIERLNSAIIQRCCVRISHRSVRRQRPTRRTVAPYRIWFFDATFYLIGYCHRRRDIRIFAIDRIETLDILDESFEMPSDFDVAEYMRASFGVFRGEPVRVRIRFSKRVAGYIQERNWHPSQKTDPQPDGSLIMELEVAGTEEIKHWLLRWSGDAEVLAPDQLRAELRCVGEKLAALYRTRAGRSPQPNGPEKAAAADRSFSRGETDDPDRLQTA